jgi:hypothetical protein
LHDVGVGVVRVVAETVAEEVEHVDGDKNGADCLLATLSVGVSRSLPILGTGLMREIVKWAMVMWYAALALRS